MLARIRKATDEKEEGFTLIELLVVMIIIGILAAIAIPVFLSQRNKAQDTAVKADVSTIGKEIATYYVDGTGTGSVAIAGGKYIFTPTTPPVGSPATIDMGRVSKNVTVKDGAITNILSDTAWCIGLENLKGDTKTYKYSSAAGLTSGVCVGAV